MLKKRLEQTGKQISLAKYGMISVGLGVTVMSLLLFGILPSRIFGSSAGVWPAHFVIGKMIKGRVAKFTSNFPDAIELMVRGLLSSAFRSPRRWGSYRAKCRARWASSFAGQRQDEDRPTMEAALQEAADRLGTPEFQFFVITLAIQRETGGNRPRHCRTLPTCFASAPR